VTVLDAELYDLRCRGSVGLVSDADILHCCGLKAQTYEMLRDYGISHCNPHPILLTQTRSCPLLPPPPVEKIPAWKTVRPRKKLEDDQAKENRMSSDRCC